MPERECLGSFVVALEWWGNYQPCRTCGVPTGPLFAYLGQEFVDGREQSLSGARAHLYKVACSNSFVAVLMAFLAPIFPPQKLATQDLTEHEPCMWGATSEDILFPQLQHVRDFVRGIKMQNLEEGTQFDLVLSLLAVRRLDKLSWVIDGCLV